MASTILQWPAILQLPQISSPSGVRKSFAVSLRPRRLKSLRANLPRFSRPRQFTVFVPLAAQEDTAEAEEVEESISEDGSDDGVVTKGNNGKVVETDEETTSVVMTYLHSYKDALTNGDASMIAEVEALLLSIEAEKNSLSEKIAILSAELSIERERVLRISADFDNFRKRTEREKLSLVENVQGEVVENLLPVLDNFERAKTQIKVETEGEEKINNSYQSIYNQFMEILDSLGVEAVETVGNPFDPMLHEAIMREESAEYEEGIIIQEFRRGFKLGERLLRPSMVKVSAGPGPAKPKEIEQDSLEEGDGEAATESSAQGESG